MQSKGVRKMGFVPWWVWVVVGMIAYAILLQKWKAWTRPTRRKRQVDRMRLCQEDERAPILTAVVIRRTRELLPVRTTVQSILRQSACISRVQVVVVDTVGGAQAELEAMGASILAQRQMEDHAHVRQVLHVYSIADGDDSNEFPASYYSNEALRAWALRSALEDGHLEGCTHVMTLREGGVMTLPHWDLHLSQLLAEFDDDGTVVLTAPLGSSTRTTGVHILCFDQPGASGLPKLSMVPVRRRAHVSFHPSVAWTGEWSVVPLSLARVWDERQPALEAGNDVLVSARLYRHGAEFFTPMRPLAALEPTVAFTAQSRRHSAQSGVGGGPKAEDLPTTAEYLFRPEEEDAWASEALPSGGAASDARFLLDEQFADYRAYANLLLLGQPGHFGRLGAFDDADVIHKYGQRR